MIMVLKMFISNIFIEAVPIEYEGLQTCEERQRYQEKIAGDLMQKHSYKIRMAREMPVIYIEGVESKMNYFKILNHEYN